MTGEPTTGSRTLRILIIAHAFPPQNATASHRAYSWARTWRDAGHAVHVLTPEKNLLDGSMDMERDLEGIEMHEVPYLLARRGTGHATDAADARRVARWDWLKTLTRRARYSLAMFADPRLLAYFAMVREGLAVARDHNFDVIIATSPPELVFFAARALSRGIATPWVADFRDLWFRDMRLHQSRLASWLSGPVNRWLVRNAAALVTVSRGLQERLAGYLGRDVCVCYNGFFESEQGATGSARPWEDCKLHIVYTGRIYPEKRDPEPLFRVLSKLRRTAPETASRFCVDFFGFDDPWLRSLIRRHGVNEYVRVHGFVPYRDSMSAQRAADVLLFLDWIDDQAEGVLTGKLFEYFASGRPILSLGRRKDTEAGDLIAKTGCGVTLTTDDELAAFLRGLAESSRPPDIVSHARDRFSRERQAGELLKVLQRLC